MRLQFTRLALLFPFLFPVLALVPFLPQDAAAGEERPVPMAPAKWIATEVAAAAEVEARSIGMPGKHMHGDTHSPAGPNVPLPIFRKSFVLDEAAVSSAHVAICGLGHFELSVNGEKVGDHFLDPPWSDYGDTCYTVRFDVARLLKPGENVLGVMLGNGMYNVPGGRYTKFVGSYGPPKLILCLVVSQGDREQIVTSDPSWKTHDGPITFSCIYGGEDYDARREQPGWDSPGFDDSHWKPAQRVDGPGGRLRPATSPPIKVVRHLKPVSISRLTDGRYEVDLGENLSARPVIRVQGQAGSEVTVETAERRGKPWQGHSYTYTLKGGTQPEVFAPRFSYFGFQYLTIRGAAWGDDFRPARGVPELIEVGADFVSSCGPRIGAFSCSNPLLNDIDNMIDRSVASNLQHVLTDCPHREKLGWLEVAHLMGPSILFHYDMGELLRKICRDTTDSQLESGLVPDIAPEYVRFQDGFFESPEWGSACVQLPWLIHRWHGDERILREQYPTMARYTDYLAGTRNEAGLVKGGLGDWYDWTPEKGHVGPSQLTPSELPATCMLYDNARILRQVSLHHGQAADARKWEGLMQEVYSDFLTAYYDPENKTVATGSQCALALGLYFDLVPDEDRDGVLAHLVRNLEMCQYRPSTGEVSFRFLVLALAQAGRSDVVYRMINRTDPPGYGCMLKQGLKTLSERWDRPGSSLNHCMFGHIQEWFQKYLLGMRQAPGGTGYEKVLIDPSFPEDLEWAKGSFDSPNGRIDVAWGRTGGVVEVTVKAEEAHVTVAPGRKEVLWKVQDKAGKREIFTLEDRPAFLILPDKIQPGGPIPWVWYAPTLKGLPGKHEIWMFDRFLDNGIAIAGVDVGESYGNPQGRAVYAALYKELVENRGLAKQACLLARSRGGLMLYNWAVENPESVACIAGIYPVCNLSSYPGLDRACSAYGMTKEQLTENLIVHNPIDRLAPLAQAKVPIFHLHGDRDRVVPLDQNSAIVKERYDTLGGIMSLEIVKEQGHTLWSGWFQNQDLVDFVITHAGSNPLGVRRLGRKRVSGQDVEAMYPSREDRTQSPGQTIYYIDPSGGSDHHSGVEQKFAWRSFSRVNHLLLAPGDRVEVMAPGSFDQTLVLSGAGTAEAPVEIVFAPGRYEIYPRRALKRKYQISNTNDDPDSSKAIGILLEGAKHFRISGPDASIFYRGKMIEACIDRCQNIFISDLHFDYHRPTVSEFAVTAVGDGYVDLQIHRDSHYRVDNGQITWEGEGWSHQTGLAQELDLRSNEVWRRGDPLKGMTLEEINPFLVRAHGSHNMKPERVYQIRNTRRDCAGVFTRRSRNITWKNVHFQFLHGMGLVNQFSENLTFDTVSIAPDERNGRTTAAWADCIQASGCKGKLLVKNCLFSGAHDDAINIHGTHLRVVERMSDKQIKVRFMHAQTYGFMAFNPGDEIAFVRWDSLKPYGSNRVMNAELLNSKELLLTLDRPVPQTLKEKDVVENVTWTPSVEIRNCTVSRIPTRGFLITTRCPVLIEDNTFLNTHMSAILVEDDAKGWYESGCVRDMTIVGNRFIRCAEPVIHINPQNSVANNAVHQNIRIEENEFVLRDTLCVKASSTTGLSITGNTVYSEKGLHDGLAIRTLDCSGVKMGRNQYAPLPAPFHISTSNAVMGEGVSP